MRKRRYSVACPIRRGRREGVRVQPRCTNARLSKGAAGSCPGWRRRRSWASRKLRGPVASGPGVPDKLAICQAAGRLAPRAKPMLSRTYQQIPGGVRQHYPRNGVGLPSRGSPRRAVGRASLVGRSPASSGQRGPLFTTGRLSQRLPAATMQLMPAGVVLTTVQVSFSWEK